MAKKHWTCAAKRHPDLEDCEPWASVGSRPASPPPPHPRSDSPKREPNRNHLLQPADVVVKSLISIARQQKLLLFASLLGGDVGCFISATLAASTSWTLTQPLSPRAPSYDHASRLDHLPSLAGTSRSNPIFVPHDHVLPARYMSEPPQRSTPNPAPPQPSARNEPP